MAGAITRRIVDAIAAERGVDTVDLDIVLQDYIDTSALEQLGRHGGGTWTLSFEVDRHEVTVTSDDRVIVDSAVGELRA